MRFDPDQWEPVQPGSPITGPDGRLWLRVSRPSTFFASVGGVEAIAGSGTEIDLITSAPVTVKVEPFDGKPVKAFLYRPFRPALDGTSAEVFTNPDRQAFESGSVLAVRQAARQVQLEQMAYIKAIRFEREALADAVRAAQPAPLAPVPEALPPANVPSVAPPVAPPAASS